MKTRLTTPGIWCGIVACRFVPGSRLAPNQAQYGQNEILKAIFGALKGYNDAKSQ